MNKAAAIQAFESVTGLARACGVTVSAVSQWPDPLPRYAEDKVLAALTRAGRRLPASMQVVKDKTTRKPARKVAA